MWWLIGQADQSPSTAFIQSRALKQITCHSGKEIHTRFLQPRMVWGGPSSGVWGSCQMDSVQMLDAHVTRCSVADGEKFLSGTGFVWPSVGII